MGLFALESDLPSIYESIFLAPGWVRELAANATSNHSLCKELAQDATSMALETPLIRPLLPRATFHLTVIVIFFFPAEL